ncbi:hypothetical protein PVAND_009272 [Polypedilum vanderplanki]|uniref:Las1-like protein n=1 Tax=Polypedilum vanderplanki TaxID=319348 RepID=A0A9J6CCS5_POLVA|nr:hypothetical protein PVAND_009272 [Polypedilum vanderplanki]
MDLFNSFHKVSCWISVREFKTVVKLIYDEKSTIADKKRALNILQAWKIRRAQDTPLGVLCTLVLLDVLVKDLEGKINDTSVINVLYQNSLMKFINYASSFNMGNFTMYAIAKNLQLDSSLIDLRHSIAHGKQTFDLDVLRNSHEICLKWIKGYYWDKEIDNISDVNIIDLRFDLELDEKLDIIFPLYDFFAEFTHKNIKNFDQLDDSVKASDRWPTIKNYMASKKLVNFRQAFNHFKTVLFNTMASKSVRLNQKTFFYALLTKCDYFMQAYEHFSQTILNATNDSNYDDEEAQIVTPAKRAKLTNSHNRTVVNLYQDLIWQIAKNDYLKLFIEMLLQIYRNEGEKKSRRQSAHFWITITLKSYQYYQKYCKFTKSNAISQTEVSQDARNIYSYQLNVDLNNVIIFVGTQMLPSYLKYSSEFLTNLIENLNGTDEDCELFMQFMPMIYPPLSTKQFDEMKKLIDIKTSKRRCGKSMEDEIVHTVDDLLKSNEANVAKRKKNVWKREDSKICWSSLPIGYEFRV